MVVKDWVKELTRLRGYTDQMVEDANAVIFTFGSYRLGVHGPGADIDTLCIGPSYISREEDFFYVLHNMLTEMEDVSELQTVPDAHVPVMKFKFDGISIDLLYASISQLLVVPDICIYLKLLQLTLAGIQAPYAPGRHTCYNGRDKGSRSDAHNR
ncbi:Nuclear poly(A) polymerase 4 [Castilleja foliolosa]|uniref:polynucleotide adenylyltransferase n=1 Tax=Castilleja foliolosa TaxID=1961234 RepID=A0ABD3D3Z4_9LAMI